MGEGWGLTSIEHAITGNAQIVPNHSACSEIFQDVGLLVGAPIPYTLDNIMTTGYLVDINKLANTMQFCYENTEEVAKLGKQGLLKFSSPEYSWERISNRWYDIFKEAIDGTKMADE